MKRLLMLIASICAGLGINAQNISNLAISDSLYAKGVTLYNQTKYNEAIPYFRECNRIDKAELDSASNRLIYPSMWLSSCYLQLNDTITAKSLSKYYKYPPIDKRLTIESDSLSLLGEKEMRYGNVSKAIDYFLQCGKIEERNLGKAHYWHANTLRNISKIYISSADYTKAIEFCKEALGIYEMIANSEDEITSILIDICNCYTQLQDFDEAKDWGERTLGVIKANYGQLHPEYSNILMLLMRTNYALGELEESIDMGYLVLKLLSENNIENYDLYVSVLKDLYYINLSDGRYSEAINLSKALLEIEDKTNGKMTINYIVTLSDISKYYAALGNFYEAIKYGENAQSLGKSIFTEDKYSYSILINNLAYYYSNVGNYNEAIELAKEVLRLREQEDGSSANSLSALVNLSAYNSYQGNYTEALHYGEQALKIMKEQNDMQDVYEYVSVLNVNAMNYYHLGNIAQAVSLGTQALSLIKDGNNPKHLTHATVLSNLSKYYASLGDLNKSIEYESDALLLKKEILGTNHPDYVESLISLSAHHSSIGNHGLSLSMAKEAIDILEYIDFASNSTYLLALNNYANSYYLVGDFINALQIGEKALKIAEQTFGCKSKEVATILNNIASYYLGKGNNDKALEALTKALSIAEKIFGCNSLQYAVYLNNLAYYYSYSNSNEDAKKFEEQATSIRRNIFGESHPEYAASLSSWAYFCSYSNNHADAIKYGEAALSILRDNVGEHHPYYSKALYYLTCIYLNTNNIDKLENITIKNTEIIQGNLKSIFSNLTVTERRQFWDREKGWFDKVHLYTNLRPSNRMISSAYNAILFSKGILLNNEREFSDLIMESNDSTSISIFNQIKMARRQLNFLYSLSSKDINNMTDSIESAINNLERKLINRSKLYGDFTNKMNISWQNVKSKLDKNDIAIEFVAFRQANGNQTYAAYVIKKEMESPIMITLFEECELRDIPKNEYYTTNLLTKLIWGKLESIIRDCKNIYFAPAGELYNISIECLPDFDLDCLMSDSHKFYRLSSTRELCIVKDQIKYRDIAIYGGMHYETDASFLAENMNKYPQLTNRDISFHNFANSLSYRNGVNELPATTTEIDIIEKTFLTTTVRPSLYKGFDATEASFKSLSGKNINILHIATHGFYWTESEARKTINLSFLSHNGKSNPIYKEDKALARTGLLFSGANYALRGKSLPIGIEDGILTANEITQLDFRGLDLVVLSACQTGLGEISGDGVFGLQRGFKKAGANTLLMSLWKVDDKATQILMTKFYEYFISGKTKLESLTLAQKYVREYEEEVEIAEESTMTASQQRRSKRMGDNISTEVTKMKVKPFADPKYWAAFILLDALN